MIDTGRIVRDSLRALRRSPGSTIASILCLAIGIGATITMAGVVDSLLFRPPPHVRNASDVVWLRLHFQSPGGSRLPQLDAGSVPYDGYLALSEGARAIGDVAAYATRELSLDRGASAEKVDVAFVSPSFFRLLGVHPTLGRFPAEGGGEDDDAARDAHSVILAHWIWRQRFGGDSSVVGRTLRVGDGRYVVAGVAPPGFRGVEFGKTGLWLPVRAARDEIFHGDDAAFHGIDWLQVIARPMPGLSADRAAAEASAIWQNYAARRFGARFDAIVATSTESIIPAMNRELTREASVSLWLAAIATIVLVIACTNVANLLLIHALERQREMGVRIALGATRAQLIGQLFVDGALLCTLGGAAALIICRWSGVAIRTFLLPNIDGIGTTIDLRLVMFATITSALTSIGCALAPAALVSRTDVAASLTGSAAVRGRALSRARSGLLMGQIALTTALLAGAALFVASLRSLRAVDLGFDPGPVLVGRMDLEANGYSDSQADAIVTGMLERVEALPGVERASVARTAPFVGRITWPNFQVPGTQSHGERPGEPRDILELNAVAPDYFATTGTALLRGRDFSATDRGGSARVAIINATMARAYWPAGDALGKCIKIGLPGERGGADSAPCDIVIGVVQDTRTASPRGTPGLQLYLPFSGNMKLGSPTLLVRTDRDAPATIGAVRRAMQEAGPALPFADVRPLEQYIEPQLRPWRLGAAMFALFGVVALSLSMVGLYAAFAYSVSRRTKEIGIRMALGARREMVLSLVLGEGLRVASGGLLIGLALAVAVGRALGSLLVAVSWHNPAMLGAIAVLILLTATLAVYVPALRAVRVDAMTALRSE
jgi:predicted permease